MQSILLSALLQIAVIPSAPEIQRAHDWAHQSLTEGSSIPFSFVLNGTSSAKFLSTWTRKAISGTAMDTPISRIESFHDPVTGLEVRIAMVQYKDLPAVEWVVYLKNTSSQDTPIIEAIQPLDITLPKIEGDPILHYAKGATCSMEDFRPMTRVLNCGAKASFQPGGGRSSSDFLPFFNLETGQRHGVIVAVGWSGEWLTTFTRDNEGAVHIHAGMEHTHLILHPGEEIRTPRIALLFYDGEWLRGQNLFRQFILAHHRPMPGGKPLEMPILNGNWGGTPASDHLANIAAINANDLPIEYYWIDAEWFGKGPWFQTAGDWRPKSDLYPEGFKPISDSLHQSGRKLLLWFEPERVCEGTPWYTEHAEWLLEVPKEKRNYNWGASQNEPDWVIWESKRNQIKENDRLFNLANPEARKFLTDTISSLITEFGVDCYRHDANIAPLEFWRANDTPDRQGMSEIRWVEGLYAFWDELLTRHPGLIIDNCASGGRRIDLETMGRATPFWRTDYPASPTTKQCHTYGISFWVPFNSTGAIRPARDGEYAWRSTISSSVCFELFGNGDAAQKQQAPSEFGAEIVKQLLAEYKGIQKYYLGDYYPLTEYSQAEDAWIGWQFDRPDLGEGMLMIFRRPKSICETGRLHPRGLDPNANYTLHDATEERVITGKEFMEIGVQVSLDQAPSSVLLIYKQKS